MEVQDTTRWVELTVLHTEMHIKINRTKNQHQRTEGVTEVKELRFEKDGFDSLMRTGDPVTVQV